MCVCGVGVGVGVGGGWRWWQRWPQCADARAHRTIWTDAASALRSRQSTRGPKLFTPSIVISILRCPALARVRARAGKRPHVSPTGESTRRPTMNSQKKVCHRSGKTIYPAEKQINFGGFDFHASYFTCASTGTRLTLKTATKIDGDVYLRGEVGACRAIASEQPVHCRDAHHCSLHVGRFPMRIGRAIA